MKRWNAEEIRQAIAKALPEGIVIARHDSRGHFYEVDVASKDWLTRRFYEDGYVLPEAGMPATLSVGITAQCKMNPVYPSVTGKLQILKDEGLINYKMNRAIEHLSNFMFSLKGVPSMEEIGNACEVAARISQDILADAGDIGTRVHNTREVIYEEWIKTGVRPVDFTRFIKEEEYDIRVVSALRALEKMCIELDYIPVWCELLVYDDKLKTAGTLDDLALVRFELVKGRVECEHQMMDTQHGKQTCMECGRQLSRHYFTLVDLKTSNQFKDHYFFQVALYWRMFKNLVGIKPEKQLIVKLSKEDGTYKIEDLKKGPKLAEYAAKMVQTHDGLEFIKSLRKDNQKKVVTI